MNELAEPKAEARAALLDGVRRFEADDPVGAHALFGQAHRRDPSDPRAQSWYGLTLVLVERNSNLGVALCDRALRVVGADPELILNLARTHLALGQRDRVVRALQRGLDARPDEPCLVAALQMLGRRRRPVIPFLPRGNALNRFLGQIRHRWAGASAGGQATPVTLGRLPPPSRKSDG